MSYLKQNMQMKSKDIFDLFEPVLDEAGEVCEYKLAKKDVDHVKELIEILIEQKANLDEAQRLTNVGHWELNLVTNELYWSDEVYRIFGLQPQEFEATYKSFLEHIHPDDHDAVNRAYTKSLEDKSPYEIVHRVLTKEHELKYVEERCTHQFDIDGNIIGSIGTVQDITQNIKYKKELELASKVFKYSSDAIIITDADNKIVSMNKSFEKLTGYTLDEVRGKDPKILSSGWGNKEFYAKMWSDILTFGIWEGEIWDRAKNGNMYAAYQSIISVKNSEGEVVNYIGISHDITESKNKEKTIHQLAYYDFLTKLPNRQLFEQEVESFIKSSHYNDREFAILFLDLDNFKWVNDSLGHNFGDKVLIYVSQKISDLISEDFIFARLGGDEFVILAPYREILSISQLASNVIETLKNPILIDNKEVNVGWSIGISLFPENATTYELLLQNADTAMYEAKEKGKNNFKYFNDLMNTSAKERLEVDIRLRHAVEEENFTLNYQPKYSCNENRTIGFEALIRWSDAQLGFVPPDRFIPIAEESGYIYAIGLWVLKRSLQDLKTLHEHYGDSFTMAVNISGKQLENPDFYDDVRTLISESQIQPDKVEFEITETSVMKNIERVIPILQQLKSLGIRISIDDFGTGYSSMVYLKKLPIDTLKIDREFIKEIEKDDEDKAIVQAIIALSGALDLDTVAEGVELDEHKTILTKLGCEIFQGYLYSRPLPLEELISFLKNA